MVVIHIKDLADTMEVVATIVADAIMVVAITGTQLFDF